MHSRPFVLFSLILGVGLASVLIHKKLLEHGANLPSGGYEFGVGAVVVSLFNAWLGWQVQRFKTQKQTWISAVGSSRVAAFSLALSHVGAALLGFFGGQVVFLLLNLSNESLAALLGAKIVALLGSVVMVISGVVIEKICTIDPKNPNLKPPDGTAPAPA